MSRVRDAKATKGTGAALIGLAHEHPESVKEVLIDWCIGTACNYDCSYCPESLHDGAIPWPSVEVTERFCSRVIQHYQRLDRRPTFMFSGGEPTLMPNFQQLARDLSTRGCTVSVISNGSRTIAWWGKIRGYLNEVVLTHHIERVQLQRFIDVALLLLEETAVHINITMLPQRFEECLANARVIAERCDGASMTLKPLRVDFGTRLFDYTREQLDIMKKGVAMRQVRSARWPGRGRMRAFHADGSSMIIKANDLVLGDQNRFCGWRCAVGMELLTIRPDGTILRANCGQGGVVGTITDPEIRFPQVPIVCGRDRCSCATDILVTKWHAS